MVHNWNPLSCDPSGAPDNPQLQHFDPSSVLVTHVALLAPVIGHCIQAPICCVLYMCVRHFILLGSTPTIHPLAELFMKVLSSYPLCRIACNAWWAHWPRSWGVAMHSSTDLLCLVCVQHFVVLDSAPTS